MFETRKSAGIKFDDVLLHVMSRPKRYSRLLMTLSSSEKADLEAKLGTFTGGLLDARQPSFQAVFPPDILLGGQHLVLVMITERPVPNAAEAYRSLGSEVCRRMVLGLGPAQFAALNEMLKHFMIGEELKAFEQYPDENLMFDPKPGCFGAMIVRGIHPEEKPQSPVELSEGRYRELK